MPSSSLSQRCLAEFVGTAVFLTIILKSGGDKYIVIAGLLAAILIAGDVSGGHFNPAVTIMSAFNSKDQKVRDQSLYYILAQILGGLTAAYVANNLLTSA